ncbi:hypothetical protein [Mycobacteroides abscessus]|uniref:hypothetical protein n=1 Tax=Mycobacteroides abscessus TaxID=36809 RepID=UPI000C25C353|nr:hypothetical protein [Mycobacteroides abscessus]
MQHNEFNRVIDQIDALVDEQMAGGEYAAISRAEAVVTGVDRCTLCGGDWHGSPWTGVDRDHLGEYDRHSHGRALSCPGAFATGPQRIRYRWRKRQRSVMQGWLGRGQDPLQRCLRTMQNMYDFIELLTGEQPAPWQREQLASWFNGIVPNLPPEFQFPRPIRFPPPMSPRGAEATFEALDEAYTVEPARMQQHRDPWHITIGENRATYLDPTATPLAPVTLPKLYMVPARGGRQSVTRYSRGGAVLMRYWGSPQSAGTWWELDPSEGPWTDVEVTTTQDDPRDVRRGRGWSLPPLQRVFIELTAANGLRANPIGLIAVGANHRDGTHRVHRAYLKSMTDRPPLLYDDNRRASSWQPTSWAQRGADDVHPERLVDAIRGVEGL